MRGVGSAGVCTVRRITPDVWVTSPQLTLTASRDVAVPSAVDTKVIAELPDSSDR